MRTGAAAGHLGYFHEAITYSSDEEFADIAVPFLLEGVAAGEPSVAVLSAPAIAVLDAALPAGSGVEFFDNDGMYLRPAATIRAYRRLIAERVTAGVDQIRFLGQVPTFDHDWDRWAGYESASNLAYDDFPLWSLCAYDARVTPEPMLAELARTHPRFARAHGHHETSAVFTEPRAYLAEDRTPEPDPLQSGPPATVLADPTPAEARRAVRAADPGITPEDLADLVVAVSETVTNALRYGVPPVTVRVWRAPGRLVVAVTDTGPGPKDPFAGLLPAPDGALNGRGLWITHQACDHVATTRDDNGWTIRLTSGPSWR